MAARKMSTWPCSARAALEEGPWSKLKATERPKVLRKMAAASVQHDRPGVSRAVPDQERELMIRSLQTAEHAEAARAFLQRRGPRFDLPREPEARR